MGINAFSADWSHLYQWSIDRLSGQTVYIYTGDKSKYDYTVPASFNIAALNIFKSYHPVEDHVY